MNENQLQKLNQIDRIELLGDMNSGERRFFHSNDEISIQINHTKNRINELNGKVRHRQTLATNCQMKVEELNTKIDKLRKKISKSMFGQFLTPIDKALKVGVPEKKFSLLSILVGGDECIITTSSKPKERIDRLIKNAKQDGKSSIETQLRTFGFIHKYEVLETFPNEVLCLLEQFIQIKKRSPKLNEKNSVIGEQFGLTEDFTTGEKTICIFELGLSNFVEEMNNCETELANMTTDETNVPDDLRILSLLAHHKKILKYKEAELSWCNELKKNNLERFKNFLGIFQLDVGGFIELKYFTYNPILVEQISNFKQDKSTDLSYHLHRMYYDRKNSVASIVEEENRFQFSKSTLDLITRNQAIFEERKRLLFEWANDPHNFSFQEEFDFVNQTISKNEKEFEILASELKKIDKLREETYLNYRSSAISDIFSSWGEGKVLKTEQQTDKLMEKCVSFRKKNYAAIFNNIIFPRRAIYLFHNFLSSSSVKTSINYCIFNSHFWNSRSRGWY